MIPFVTYDPDGSIYLFDSPTAPAPALFRMDTKQARELVAMLVDSIASIERDGPRIELFLAEQLERARVRCRPPLHDMVPDAATSDPEFDSDPDDGGD